MHTLNRYACTLYPVFAVIAYLTQIKGVGKWTVQMILMFPMDRPNIFPVDDLGIQNVMKKIYIMHLSLMYTYQLKIA